APPVLDGPGSSLSTDPSGISKRIHRFANPTSGSKIQAGTQPAAPKQISWRGGLCCFLIESRKHERTKTRKKRVVSLGALSYLSFVFSFFRAFVIRIYIFPITASANSLH